MGAFGGRAVEKHESRLTMVWRKYFIKWLLVPGVLVVGFSAVLLTTEPTGVIQWQDLRAVAFESDDWGLPGFVPFGDVWQGQRREDLIPGHFPDVYWESTLEDAQMVQDLCSIMASEIGADGLPAVFQPNYVLSSLSYEKQGKGWVWKRYNLPDLPPTYERPGMWTAVEQGISKGLWYPEFHATWHYDPSERFNSALETEFSQQMTQAGVMLFPRSENARELGAQRSIGDLKAELIQSQRHFNKIFNRPLGSIIAPDYTWNDRVETMWQTLGIHVIQAKREQRDPTLLSGKAGRILKLLKRKWSYVGHRQRIFLERNCRLEPVQAPDPEAVVRQCALDARKAWDNGKPAIVETHRVNFSHNDPEIVVLGQSSLKAFLEAICEDSQKLPTFLVDTEIAQLQRKGVSWVMRGDKLVLRNATHSRRLIGVTRQNVTKWFMLSAGHTFITIW